MVAQEDGPLAVVGNLRRLIHDLDDRMALFLPQAHEDARHEREVKRHVAFVAVAEIGTDVGRPLIRFREQHAPAVVRIELPPEPLEDVVRLEGSR